MQNNPFYYGLPSGIQLEVLDNNRLGIRKVIKSRIILKNATKIIEIARQIKSRHPELEITLICTRNICSKSIALLVKERIEIVYFDK